VQHPLPQPKLVQDEVFDPFRPGQMEPYGSPLPVPMDLESEKRAAPSFQLNPFDQLIDANLFGVHLEGIAVRQLAPFPNRVAERLDEPLVARPFLRGYSIDVAGESGHGRSSSFLCCGFVVHKNQSCHECRD